MAAIKAYFVADQTTADTNLNFFIGELIHLVSPEYFEKWIIQTALKTSAPAAVNCSDHFFARLKFL